MAFKTSRKSLAYFFSVKKEKHGVVHRDADDGHYLYDIQEIDGVVRLSIMTLRYNSLPSRIYSRPSGAPARSWKTDIIFKDDTVMLYRVDMPLDGVPTNSRFYRKSGARWVRILQPYHAGMTIPEGWSFTHKLELNYRAPVVVDPQFRVFIREVVPTETGVVIRGPLLSSVPVETAELAFRKFRDEARSWIFPIKLTDANRVFGIPAACWSTYLGHYPYQMEIELAPDWQGVPPCIYSLTVHAGELSAGLRQFTNTFGKRKNLFQIPDGLLLGFIDRSSETLRFERYNFGLTELEELRAYAKGPAPEKPVCLFGEYTNAARDNAYHLFRHMQGNERVAAYYVAEPECLSGPDVLPFGSLDHMRASVHAKAVVFTHHASYVLPYLAQRLRRRAAKTFFLQHGVTALKNSMKNYTAARIKYDAFNVCSFGERAIVEKACRYAPKNIAICGFPRHDKLLELAKSGRSDTIMVFPTWRANLEKLGLEAFAETEFCKQWAAALTALRQIAKVELVWHPIIELHELVLTEYADSVVPAEHIQELLANCRCLVTDYSSLAFDALYIDKPVFFFTFDEDMYRFRQNAYIDIDRDLPGPRFLNADALAEAVKATLQIDVPPYNDRIRSRYFRHIDDQNCTRAALKVESLCGLPRQIVLPPAPEMVPEAAPNVELTKEV